MRSDDAPRSRNGFGPAAPRPRNGLGALSPGRDSRLRFRDWRFRVRDILGSVEAIIEYTDGMTYEQFVEDRKTVDAVIRNLMMMGESVRWLPLQVQEQHRDVPWRGLRGVRNVVVHEYFGVDPHILWVTCRHDLPPLVARLEAVLVST